MITGAAQYAIAALSAFGAYSLALSIARWWKLQTRGEYHCPQCHQVSPLPKDE